jgi:hypothetical protein
VTSAPAILRYPDPDLTIQVVVISIFGILAGLAAVEHGVGADDHRARWNDLGPWPGEHRSQAPILLSDLRTMVPAHLYREAAF